MTATGQPSNAAVHMGVTGPAGEAAGQDARPDLHAAFRRMTESLRVAWDADRVTLWLFQPDSHELALGAVAQAVPAARTALALPDMRARSAYVTVVPPLTRRIAFHAFC